MAGVVIGVLDENTRNRHIGASAIPEPLTSPPSRDTSFHESSVLFPSENVRP